MICRRVYLWVACVVFALSTAGHGQNKMKVANDVRVHVPSVFHPQYAALGDRVHGKQKEKTVYKGWLFDGSGNSYAVRVVHQYPKYLRIEGAAGDGSVLSFNGKTAKGLSRREDEILLETFLLDAADGVLLSLQESVELRLMGLDSGPDPRLFPGYIGPRYDVFETTERIVYSKKPAWRSKRYFFDSKTKLLDRTQYYDQTISPPAFVETVFSVWGTIGGSAFPARIERYENEKFIFSFIAESIESGAGIDLTNF